MTRQERLTAYTGQIQRGRPADVTESVRALEAAPAGAEAPPAAPEERILHEAALEGWHRLQAGQGLTEGQMDAVEAIILPRERPVIDIIHDSFHDPSPPWAALSQKRATMEAAIRSVGRIEVQGYPGLPYGGTGFLVGPRLILTNRHVAELFIQGVGAQRLRFYAGRTASIDLKEEIIPSPPIEAEVTGAVIIHPYWDAAILRITGFDDARTPLTLAGSEPSDLPNRVAAIIGYPAFDPRNNAELQHRIFRGVFERKRLQPGHPMGYRVTRSYGSEVEALAHDCSTLGGNSGSALIDVETGEVLGLHFAGLYLEANYTVPAWQLALDPRVRDLGVSFSGSPPSAGGPAWLDAWQPLEKEEAAPVTESGAGPAVKAVAAELLTPASYEHADYARIAEALRKDPEAARRWLTDALGAADAADLIEDLREPATQEWIFGREPEPDPDLPEIVFLHGIMGGHLERRRWLIDDRIWLDPSEIVLSNVARALTLHPDGVSEADGKSPLRAAGPLRMVYEKAARKWRKQRFAVHEYSFDWRKSIPRLGDDLASFLDTLDERRPGRPVVLVAHSMGGLVACAYAMRHLRWRDRVLRAIFLGTPLGGSFAPMEAYLGSYAMIRKLAWVSPRNNLDDLRAMSVSLPGLANMLPAPSLFPGAEALYRQAGWPQGVAPRQRWLDESRNLKTEFLGSPLLQRTTLLVSLEHGTMASYRRNNSDFAPGPRTAAGDGTVPGKAAAVDGAPAFKVRYEHGYIPKDPLAIQAVLDLIQNGSTNLEPVGPGELADDIVLPESPPLEMPEGAERPIQERFEKGRITQADLRWLFEPGFERIPEG